MNIATLIDEEVMTRLAMYGTIRGIDSYALHLLKTSEHPIMRFRRAWMRETALRQHLEAERRQKKINDEFKREPFARRASVRRAAVIDQHLADEMRHYNGASINDREHMGAIRREAPAIFPKRETCN